MSNGVGSGHGPSTPVLVTGGASGIGAACAEALARDGRPVVLWDIDEDRVSRHAAGLDRPTRVERHPAGFCAAAERKPGLALRFEPHGIEVVSGGPEVGKDGKEFSQTKCGSVRRSFSTRDDGAQDRLPDEAHRACRRSARAMRLSAETRP